MADDKPGRECAIFVLSLIFSVGWPGLISNIISQGKCPVPNLASIKFLIWGTQLTVHCSSVGVAITTLVA